MKVGHFYSDFRNKGGITSYIQRVSIALRREGHEIIYYSAAPQEAPAVDGNSIEYVKNVEDLSDHAIHSKLDILHTHATLQGEGRLRVPFVHTLHNHSAYCPSGTRYLKTLNKPCDRAYGLMGCVWGHLAEHCGSVRPQNFLYEFQHTRSEMRQLKNAPIIAVSHFLKQQLERSGYSSATINVLHHPAPMVKSYAPPPRDGAPRFLFIGRITPPKGLEWLLRAVRQITTPICLDIAGDGYQEPEMRALAERLNLSDRVTFHGWVRSEEMARLIKAARVVVVPSVWHEPAGLVNLEAAANGRAVIGSRVGGLPEYAIDGKNALLVEPNDLFGMADAIQKLALSWELSQQLGQVGYEMATHRFSLQEHIRKLVDLYQYYHSASQQNCLVQ